MLINNKKEFHRVYIRHAEKEYANGDSMLYKHDPGITDNGIEKSKMVAKHLVEQWGYPNFIIVSPFRRTRETASIMNNTLETPVKIIIDSKLSEYLGNHRTVPIDVTENTQLYNPPHPEIFNDMKKRVKKHHDDIIKFIENNNKTGGVIWIITHGLIIKQVAYLINIKMAKEFSTLTCLSITDGDEFTKGEMLLFNNIESNSDSTED